MSQRTKFDWLQYVVLISALTISNLPDNNKYKWTFTRNFFSSILLLFSASFPHMEDFFTWFHYWNKAVESSYRNNFFYSSTAESVTLKRYQHETTQNKGTQQKDIAEYWRSHFLCKICWQGLCPDGRDMASRSLQLKEVFGKDHVI